MRAIQQCNAFHDRIPNLRDRLKYCSDMRPYTMVLEIPDLAFWKDAVKADDFTSIFKADIEGQIGISIVNPLDQFARKKGLKQALANLKPTMVRVEELRLQADGDIMVSLTVAGQTRIHVMVGRSNERAVVLSDCRYQILDMYQAVYGRKPTCSTQP